ncbi:MAG: nucleoside kinase, partial [Bacteroidaceae bacterium]|nr:nucleoside kinase [Bacteroidaceae bacterium]
MGKTVTIRCKNTGRSHKIPMGFTLEEVYEMLEIDLPLGPTSAKVNNKVEGLHFMFFNDKDVEFLDITSASGMRTYTRSLFFVLYKAVHDLSPDARLRIDTPVSNGYCCHIEDAGGTDDRPEVDVAALRKHMQEIVDADLPFHRITCPSEEAIALFRR